MIGSIVDGIDQRNLTSIVNIIIVSDHGMAETSKSRIIYLDQLLDPSTIDHYDCWPLRGLHPHPGQNITEIYNSLESKSENQPWNVYLRDVNMPPQWHFTATYRIAPIYLVPDLGWVFVPNKKAFDADRDGDYLPRGIHGYDNDEPLMRSLFLARGPKFNYPYEVAPFDNVEVYGMMSNILGIKPIANNGTLPKGRMQRLQTSTTPAATPTVTAIGAEPTGSDDDITDMSLADWEEIEDYLNEEEAANRPLTWKEYLAIKAAELKEELEAWWDWLQHGGHQ
jgi:Type I phosphodiesterase / nucleotide pyrophosphatase